MKVLILNGSPRRNGKVSQILHTMEKRLQDDGNETEFVDVNTLDFKCCIGCMKCRESGKCILPQDDAQARVEGRLVLGLAQALRLAGVREGQRHQGPAEIGGEDGIEGL